jgi:hypothetical protein
MTCSEYRARVEAGRAQGEAQHHAAGCRACAGYAAAAAWSGELLRAGEVRGTAPGFPRLWAGIQRRAENSWAGALSLSFMRLAPYLAAVSLLLLVAGTLSYRSGRAPGISSSLLLAGSSRHISGAIAPDMTNYPAATFATQGDRP